MANTCCSCWIEPVRHEHHPNATFDGPLIIEPQVFGDERGFFMESWNAAAFAAAGLDLTFVQDNHSRSQKGVLRGLHFQNPGPRASWCAWSTGAVFDVAVDLRRSSPTFGQWVGVELSAENKRMFWVPEGFAHGFLTLRTGPTSSTSAPRPMPRSEHSLAWDDPDVGIEWPLDGIDVQLSAKDRARASLGRCAGLRMKVLVTGATASLAGAAGQRRRPARKRRPRRMSTLT
jgi:dTDP-4-dehydrorhamnose 3,5-epimerase